MTARRDAAPASPATETPPGPYVVLSAERRVGYARAAPIHCPTLTKAQEIAANLATMDGGEFMVLELLGTMSARAHWEPAWMEEIAPGQDASSIYP